MLFLNSRNVLIANEPMWEGSVDESAVYIREIMRRALDLHATALIVVHNHPSGDPSPSQQDIRLTRDLAEAGRHLGITLHDHVIVGANGHSSLRSEGPDLKRQEAAAAGPLTEADAASVRPARRRRRPDRELVPARPAASAGLGVASAQVAGLTVRSVIATPCRTDILFVRKLDAGAVGAALPLLWPPSEA